MALTLKEAARLTGIPAALLRALVSLKIVPGVKVRGAWTLEQGTLERIVAAYTLLRQAPQAAPAPPAQLVSVQDRCPNCGEPYGKVSEQHGGWGEFYACKACGFSIHEHNLGSPELIQHTVDEYRRYVNS